MESDLREAFKIFDRDCDGYISIHEFRRVGAELCSMMDGDGLESVFSGGRGWQDLMKIVQVSTLLGTNLRCDEIEELMQAADLVRIKKLSNEPQYNPCKCRFGDTVNLHLFFFK